MLRWTYDIFIKTKYSKKGVKFITKQGTAFRPHLGHHQVMIPYYGIISTSCKGRGVNELNVRQLSFLVRGTCNVHKKEVNYFIWKVDHR